MPDYNNSPKAIRIRQALTECKWTKEVVSPVLQRECGLTIEDLIAARTNPFTFGVAKNNGKEVRIEQLLERLGQRGLLQDAATEQRQDKPVARILFPEKSDTRNTHQHTPDPVATCDVKPQTNHRNIVKMEKPSSEDTVKFVQQEFEHQREGVAWMKKMEESDYRGGILADDMGLGKTFQAITVIKDTHEKGDQTLIVCPLSLMRNWGAELAKFAPNLSVCLFHGTVKFDDSADCVVTNYESISGKPILKKTEWTRVILDEADYIRNDIARSRHCYDLIAMYRWCLTGTPINNEAKEVGSFCRFMGECAEEEWEELSDRCRKPQDYIKPAREMLSRIMRRNTKEVLELKKIDRKPIPLQLSETERRRYDEAALVKGECGFAKATRLRRLCDGEDKEGHSLEIVAKKDWILAKVQEIHQTGDKLIIFSNWTDPLIKLQALLKKVFQLEAEIYCGDLTPKDRDAVLSRFKTESSRTVLLMTVQSGGVGLNIQEANHVIILEPNYNPQKTEQAIARVHRLGQQKQVYVYDLFIQDSVELRVNDIIKIKEEIVEVVVQSNSRRTIKREN